MLNREFLKQKNGVTKFTKDPQYEDNKKNPYHAIVYQHIINI